MVEPTVTPLQAQAQIDLRITKLFETIRALKEERNTHSIAVRLPPEILTHIFLYVVHRIYESRSLPLEQLSIPHVCRYWRTVAIRSQEFWQFQPIGQNGLLWPPEMIERAGGRPPYIWGRVGDGDLSWSPSVFPPLARAVSSARALHIEMSTEMTTATGINFLESFPVVSLPNLESLTLYSEDSVYPIIISTKFLPDGAPNLKKLVIDNFDWEWDSISSLLPSSLTSLVLHGHARWDEDCVEALQRLTSLQYLEITDTREPQYHGDPGSRLPRQSPTIKMPHLRDLYLQGDPLYIVNLILEFDIPLSTSIDITARHASHEVSEDEDYPEFNLLFKWIHLHFEKLDKAGMPMSALKITNSRLDEENVVGLYFFNSPNPFPDSPCSSTNAKPVLEITFTKYYASREKQWVASYFEAAFWRIMPHLPLRNIRLLDLYGLPVMECPQIAFSGLTGVKTLWIYSDEALSLLYALIPRSKTKGFDSSDEDDDSDVSDDEIPLPALESLFLPNPFFSERTTRILDFVVHRTKCRRPITKLSLANRQCVPDALLKDLCERVPVVRFDTDEKEGTA
ncbi:hypothetical protein NLI96_g942 [Meripilus lineatus]|uniref:F-box domain-containing protein n=1 Tax=Meripilus lineatus TaxID=2056292 RepID=A0AAD5VBA9_9APHY|nr:hypothetical protein NLI96_g942 [Physisporinus lineatus]